MGVGPIVAVVGFQAEALEALCGPGVRFAYQRDPRGTGHAVLTTAGLLGDFDGEILILNGDVPFVRVETLRRLVDTHRQAGSGLTLGTAVVEDPHGWGRIVRDGRGVSRIVEERDATPEIRAIQEVNVGLYCVAPSVLYPMLEQITPDNEQGEIYLTDLVERTLQAGISVTDVEVEPAEVAQINSRGELARMERSLRMHINSKWLDEGVTLEDPDTTYIEPGVMIGRDTVIGPNVQLRGQTVIGENCRLDGTILMTDARLGDDVHVKFSVVISDAEVGNRCQIGPFAQLRPGTRLAEDVQIGNFVETKKASLGPGTKANHLAYLGDTEIGCDTNIGAGTITCNYDGFHKNRTVIGDRVQVGSDTQLVAPVTVGDDAYVATGTTVREDVPAGSLVFNRKEDLQREGWVAQFRQRQVVDEKGKRKSRAAGQEPSPKKRSASNKRGTRGAAPVTRAKSGKTKRGATAKKPGTGRSGTNRRK